MTNEALGKDTLYRDPTPLGDTKNIETLIDGIRHKTMGADVREAIATALEVTYETAASEGNANMEVAKARGEFDNLALHLSNINANANTANKLAQSLDATKLDKKGIEQITYEMLTQDVKEKLTGGSVAVVGQNAVSTSNIVNGSVTATKLDERMGFGVVMSGELLIDATAGTVKMTDQTWVQVGKNRFKPSTTITAPFSHKPEISQYVVFNDETQSLSVREWGNIPQIGNRETILAILFNNVLSYPTFAKNIVTKGIEMGERGDFINGSWGSVIQGTLEYDPTRGVIVTKKVNGNFIVAFKNNYVFNNALEDKEIPVPNDGAYSLYYNVLTGQIDSIKMDDVRRISLSAIPKSANRIKLADFYEKKLHTISNPNSVYTIGDHNVPFSLETFKVDLQTRRTVVVTLGDSTTDGYRTSGYAGNQLGVLTSKPNTWTEKLNDIINKQKDYGFNHKFYNRGFSGKTINWLRQNLDAVLAPITEKIDYAFITMGINDSIYDASKIQAFRDDHVNVINRLIAKGIKPILMSTQAEFENYNRFGSKINSIADNIKKDLAAELGIPYIDYNAGTRNILNNSEYSVKALIPDMCHFGDLGHQKSAEFLAGQLIHQTMSIDKPTKLGYQNNKVVSDLNYSDHLTDDLKEIKWITRKDGFDLEGQLNASEAKTMFEVSVYIEQPMTVNYFGDNVTVTSNGQPLSNGTTLDIGFYRITVKNQSNMVSKFRGLKFSLKEV
ncbi:SGNH/GDSL hydrolase family protein [Streptococcus suis]|nr:SGNH/GDSL hydrolase family protein [Streptococcus suis]